MTRRLAISAIITAATILGPTALASHQAFATPAPGPSTAALLDARTGARLTAGWAGSPEVGVGGRITVRGRVTPTASTHPTATVRIERRSGAHWGAVATAQIGPDGTWSAAVTAARTPSAQTYRARLIVAGTPRVTTSLPTLDVYRTLTYTVTTRGTVHADLREFTRTAAATYAAPRGWQRAHLRFRHVTRGGDYTLVLAQARTMPTFSPGCSVRYSCRAGRNVVINETPWLHATPAWTGTLNDYRRMVIDHETGHFLGFGHASCPRPGAPAPVMQQQSKSLQGCRPNPWPLTSEITRLR